MALILPRKSSTKFKWTWLILVKYLSCNLLWRIKKKIGSVFLGEWWWEKGRTFLPSAPPGSTAGVSFAMESLPGRCGFLTLLFLAPHFQKTSTFCSSMPNVPASERKENRARWFILRLIKHVYEIPGTQCLQYTLSGHKRQKKCVVCDTLAMADPFDAGADAVSCPVAGLATRID